MTHPSNGAVKARNIFDLSTTSLAEDEEVFEPLAKGEAILIERIISRGQVTPPGEWYDQERDEWVVLLQGQASLRLEGQQTIDLGPGDALLLPAHCRHRVEATSIQPPCIWLAVHGELRATDTDQSS